MFITNLEESSSNDFLVIDIHTGFFLAKLITLHSTSLRLDLSWPLSRVLNKRVLKACGFDFILNTKRGSMFC